MPRLSIAFHNYLTQGKIPIVYCRINTHLAARYYGKKELQGIFSTSGMIADGTYLADGSITAGGGSVGNVADKSARVLDFGSLERSLVSQTSNLLSSFSGKQQQHNEIVLDNADDYFSKMLPKEPFLSRTLSIHVGFEDLPQSDHPQMFQGIITEVSIDESTMRLLAEEG